MSATPAHAKPRSSMEEPMRVVESSGGDVKTDFTSSDVYGIMSFGSTAVPGATGRFGIRYALRMKYPSASVSETRIFTTHLVDDAASQPGTTNRRGKPCSIGMSTPFM